MSSSELLAGEWGEGTLCRGMGMGRGRPWAAPDRMSVIMKPEERSGTAVLPGREGRERQGEAGEAGGEPRVGEEGRASVSMSGEQ